MLCFSTKGKKALGIILMLLIFSVPAYQATKQSRCRSLGRNYPIQFIGQLSDPSSYEISIKCHSDSHTMSFRLYFRVDQNPSSGEEGYLLYMPGELDLRIREGDTSNDTELVFSMNGSEPSNLEWKKEIQRHVWVMVLISIDEKDVEISIKDKPDNYSSQNGNTLEDDYLDQKFQWASVTDTTRTVTVGKHTGTNSAKKSFIGTMAAIIVSCRMIDEDYIDEPYYGIASMNIAEPIGIWLVDKNESATVNSLDTNNFSPKLINIASAPLWSPLNNEYIFSVGKKKII